jgi:hypothetical protein
MCLDKIFVFNTASLLRRDIHAAARTYVTYFLCSEISLRNFYIGRIYALDVGFFFFFLFQKLALSHKKACIPLKEPTSVRIVAATMPEDEWDKKARKWISHGWVIQLFHLQGL